MKLGIILLLIAIPVVAVPYLFMGKTATRTQKYAMSYEAGAQFDVKSRNGRIKVVVDPDLKEIVIEATFTAQGESEEEAEARLDLFDLKLVQGEKGLRVIEAQIPEDKKSQDACSLVIRTPGGSIGRLRSSNGGITTQGLLGPGHIETSNGSVTVQEPGAGDLKLSSSNGTITVTGALGKVTANSSNGSISVTLADGAKSGLNLDTSNGTVKIDVPASMGGVIDASTSNGSVKVTNKDLANSIDLKKSSGHIKLKDAGPKSTIASSNGSVKINLR